MFRKILVPTDGSDLSDKALNAAVEMAHHTDGSIVVLSVAEPYPYSPLSEGAVVGDAQGFEEKSRELAQGHVDRAKQIADARHVRCETIVTHSFDPHDEIIKAARNQSCDSIFMATHGRKGLRRLFIGSETQKVLAEAEVPVTVFR